MWKLDYLIRIVPVMSRLKEPRGVSRGRWVHLRLWRERRGCPCPSIAASRTVHAQLSQMNRTAAVQVHRSKTRIYSSCRKDSALLRCGGCAPGAKDSDPLCSSSSPQIWADLNPNRISSLSETHKCTQPVVPSLSTHHVSKLAVVGQFKTNKASLWPQGWLLYWTKPVHNACKTSMQPI